MIEIVKNSGFCQGVKAAIDTANSYAKGVYLYGKLVNNNYVMNQYREKGFVITEDITNIPPGSTLIIRAHGAPKWVFDSMPNLDIVDCTCVKVKRVHEIVKGEDDGKIVIVGKKNHPEVIGTLGWCNNGIVFESETDSLNISAGDNICVVGQTTCNPDWWGRAVELILERCPTATIHNTLCDVTVLKRKRAQKLAGSVDIMVVVGDKESANSTELYDACVAENINTIFISSKEDFVMEGNIRESSKIGLVGSASAPSQIIEESYEYLAFMQFIATAKAEIEEKASNVLQFKPDGFFIENALKDLREQHLGGKYIRGAIIKLGEQIVSAQAKNFLDVAAAYEIFQTAILIHDDIMDRSETRRGKKTIHAKDYEATNDHHYAFSRALCIGDMGQFYANNILANANIDDAIKVAVFKEFSNTQIKTIEGEIIDVLWPYSPLNPALEYDEFMDIVYTICDRKTAHYTVEGPLMIGMICGGADEGLLQKFRPIAKNLGTAFQIKDDLLGMFADDKTLGKPALSDLTENKQTILYGYAYKNSAPAQREILDKLYGKQNATHENLEAVRDIFTKTGAKKFAEDKINEISQNCLDNIADLPGTEGGKTLLRGLVHYLTVRRY